MSYLTPLDRFESRPSSSKSLEFYLDSLGGRKGRLCDGRSRHGPPADGVERGEAGRRHLGNGGREVHVHGGRRGQVSVSQAGNMDEQLKVVENGNKAFMRLENFK